MAGHVRLKCQDETCRSLMLLASRQGMMRPVDGAVILGVHFGRIYAQCGVCYGTTAWGGRESRRSQERRAFVERRAIQDRLRAVNAPRFMNPDAIVALIEERWSAFSKEKLRERGRVASGLRFDVFLRDDFRCRYCGRSIEDGIILHADHVIAESKGGPTTLGNLVTACSDCNLGKSDKDLLATVQTTVTR